MNTDSTLIINLNEEYKIKIETGNEFNRSIFKEVYETALNSVKEIVNQSYTKNGYDDFNNIIAFTGERGKGKSSSMISFREALVGKNKDIHKDFFSTTNILNDKQFATIDIVDPSLFRGGESLFEIILAQMFQRFQIEIKDENCKLGDDDRRSIIKQFQEVFENLQIINSDRKELYQKESIEALSRLATSSNLRKCFKNLVEIYLQKFQKNGKNEGFLVIAIDDFDLNISGAYDMLEDIRQFLIQSNIILLIACKMEQLKEVVQNHYIEKGIQINSDLKAKKYLDKIFPFERRINLPDLNNQVYESFKIIDSHKVIFETLNNKFSINVLKLLFNHLKLFQPLNILKQNPIIPETIRQTQNFINILLSSNNQINIKNYLINELSSEDVLSNHIKELEAISDDIFLILLNKKLIKLYQNKNAILDKNLKTLNNATIPDRISIADIVYILKEYEKSIELDDYYELKFIGYLKFYIGLRLQSFNNLKKNLIRYGYINEYVDVLTYESNNRFNRNFVQFNSKQINLYILNFNSVENLCFSMWIQYLGNGYQEYRSSKNKDIFVDSFENGYISPTALFHSCHKEFLEELSNFYHINPEDDLYSNIITWSESSIFVEQLLNPSFTLKLVEYIREFRYVEVKEALPSNYYDTVCLLFNYGTLYALKKLQNEYKIDGLVEDYLQNPVYLSMLLNLTNKSYSYRAANDLMNFYNLKGLKFGFEFPTKVIELINQIYELSKIEITDNKETKFLSDKAKSVLNDIKWHLENRKITSKIIGNRLSKLSDKDIDSEIINKLNLLKYNLNRVLDSEYAANRDEILKYIKSILNG